MKILIKIVSYIFLFCTIVVFFSLSFYSPVSLNDDDTFKINVKAVSEVEFNVNKSDFPTFIGWYRASITPTDIENTTRGMFMSPYKKLLDSVYVSCIYLKKGEIECVILSYDILLVTPELANVVKAKLLSLGIDKVYFSASHTHSSIGGYGKGMVATIALGDFNYSILDSLVEQTMLVVEVAKRKQDTLQDIIYSEKKINRAINRLTKENYVEEGLRQIHFLTNNSRAVLSSLNIHPTFIWSGRKVITGDYPKIFSKNTETEFGMFLAGTMGSIKPMNFKIDTTQITKFKAVIDATQYVITDSIIGMSAIGFWSIKLKTPKLAPLLTERFSASNFLSQSLLGNIETSIEVIRIGEVLMVALPCELSSEFYPELQQLAEQKDLRLMVTSFNGSYVGYATPSRNFEINHAETRTMNWTGKYGGDYYNELVKLIIEKQR